MIDRFSSSRRLWLASGIAIGICISYFWPYEPAQATVTDRSDKFAVLTVPVSTLGGIEGVFVMDFLTGRLQGGVLNQRNRGAGTFTYFYYRNVAADFGNVGSPQYAIVSGGISLPSQGGLNFANGAIYIAELTTGRVIAYSFPFREVNGPVAPIEMIKLDTFPFREPLRTP